MRKVILPVLFVATNTLVVACSFNAHMGSDPQTPAQPPPPTAPAATPASHPTVLGPHGPLGRRTSGAPGPSPTPTSSATTPPPTPTAPAPGPTAPPMVNGTTPFGSGTATGPSFTGAVYYIVPGTATMPTFTGPPLTLIFTPTLNTASQPMTGGFPGVDKTRNTYFAIRFQAPLVVTAEADYDFRVVADDGAVLSIDGTTIVDDGGQHASATEKDGPVHLIAGTHQIQVDYLQTTGNVALQVYCKKANGTEQICPTQL